MSRSRHSPRHARLLEAGALTLVGIFVLIDAWTYPSSLTAGTPGPAFFPRLLAALLIGCASWLAFRGNTEQPDRARSGARLWLAALAIAGFLLLLPIAGTLLALPFLTFALMWLSGERSRIVLASVPVLFAGFAHVLFVVVLGVPLP